MRPATLADLDWLSTVLARAFRDDPIMVWTLPEAVGRESQLVRFFGVALRARLARGDAVITTSRVEAGAVWAPPGRWKAHSGEVVRQLPGLARVFWRHPIVPTLSLFTMQRHHPRAPHWYLNNLGTEPASRSRGLGSALLRFGLDHCDRDGVGCFLETGNPENLAFYGRRGFRVVDELEMPMRGPRVWLLWRDPERGARE